MKTKSISNAACNRIVDLIKRKANQIEKEQEKQLMESDSVQSRAKNAVKTYRQLPIAIQEQQWAPKRYTDSELAEEFAEVIAEHEYQAPERKINEEIAVEVMLLNFNGTPYEDILKISAFK